MKYLLILAGLLVAGPLSAQICNDAIEQTAFQARFEVDAVASPSVTTDLATGLKWQRCAVGLVFNDNGGSADITTHSCDVPTGDAANDQVIWDWNQAIERAHQEGSGWRLPNIKELGSLVEHGCSSPAINPQIFPNTSQSSAYWANTPNATTDSSAWAVEFANGSYSVTDKRTSLPIRLVNDQ